MGSGFKIISREQSARSRQHRGILTQVICEFETLEILRIEMESGSACDSQEFGEFAAVHVVVDGTPLFRTSTQSSDLMPGDSIVFTDDGHYTISNPAPTRSVILSVLFKPGATEGRATPVPPQPN
jgi:hypothetical protein